MTVTISAMLSEANAMLKTLHAMALDAHTSMQIKKIEKVTDRTPFDEVLAQALHSISDAVLDAPTHEVQPKSDLNSEFSLGLTASSADQRASISFERLIQVSSKAIEAYKEIENMQV